MTRRTAQILFVAAFGALVATACGDDSTTADGAADGDGAVADGAPTMQAISAAEADVGDALRISVVVDNASDIALTWSVTSTTLADIAQATLTGTNTGATLEWTPDAAQVGSHEVVVTAAYEGGVTSQTATVTVNAEPCFYPGPNGFARGLAFPDFAWTAQYADGTEFTFDLYDFYCDDAQWGQYESILFLISTVWCPNCPAYIQWIDALSDQLEENGMLVLYLEVQDGQGGTIGTTPANQHLNLYTPNGSGVRAGDGDNQMQPDGVLNSGLVEYFPTSFVLRRDDMSLIADQRDTSYYLPLVEIAMDPSADWSSPPQPGIVPEFPSNCADDQDEEFEPNNTLDDAGTIAGTMTVEGGVCDSQADYYYVDIEGDWSATLQFSNALGDLDMYIWDVEAQGPLQAEDGSPIGSDTSTDDEEFTFSGPAYLFVYGFRGATAPYTLTITAL